LLRRSVHKWLPREVSDRAACKVRSAQLWLAHLFEEVFLPLAVFLPLPGKSYVHWLAQDRYLWASGPVDYLGGFLFMRGGSEAACLINLL
jgi:hypothetical protein